MSVSPENSALRRYEAFANAATCVWQIGSDAMFKTILLIKKRDGMSRQEFSEYYDKGHLPFMLKLLPGKLAVHRRNYIVDAADFGNREQSRRLRLAG